MDFIFGWANKCLENFYNGGDVSLKMIRGFLVGFVGKDRLGSESNVGNGTEGGR